jgi:heme/copper-type cytochrome/quinol oxidase subunit 2
MKKHANRSRLHPLPNLLGFALSLSMLTSTRARAQQVQIIEISAKKYEYSGSPIHVKLGTKVQLRINATDHDHGFKVAVVPDGGTSSETPGLVFTSAQDCWLLEKGETSVIEFLAQTLGSYTFRCCHTCGLGHKAMKGQIIVDR